MRILLVTPPFTERERYGKLTAAGTLYPPLGLAYVAAVAEGAGHEVRVVDSEASGYGFDDVRRAIVEFEPGIVGMQAVLPTLRRALKVARIAKEVNPDVRVVLGGVQPTICPQDAIADEAVDFVVRGEGEETLRELLEAVDDGRDYGAVRGLVWKDRSGVHYAADRPLIKNLDVIPFPARHLFPMERYHSSAYLRGNRTYNLLTSRGCPYRCAYCSSSTTFGKSFRYHSAGRVLAEIRTLVDKYGADGIQFYDDTFTLNRRRVVELCDLMIAERLTLPWSCLTRVDLVDPELLERMRAAGCYHIFYGVEAGSQRLLDLVKKGITMEQVRDAFRITREAGIQTTASFIIGLPTETVEDSRRTIDLAIEIDADYAQWEKLTPFPGSELYEICQQNGRFLTDDWSKFTAWNELVYVTDGRTPEDICAVEREAFRRFYGRPGFVLRRSRTLLKLPMGKRLRLVRSALGVLFG